MTVKSCFQIPKKLLKLEYLAHSYITTVKSLISLPYYAPYYEKNALAMIFVPLVNYNCKLCIILSPDDEETDGMWSRSRSGANAIKLFMAVSYEFS